MENNKSSPVRLVAQQDDHLSNDFIYIHQLPLRSALLEQQADPADDVGRTRCVFDDSRRRGARLLHIGLIARKPSQAGVGVGDGGSNRLIDLVRQRSGQLSLCGLAIAEKLSSFMTVAYLEERAKRAKLERLEELLSKVPNVAPEDED